LFVTFICHKYHIKHTSKQYKLGFLKSELKRDTKATPTCAITVLSPQTNVLW